MKSTGASFSDHVLRMLAPLADGLSFLPRATAPARSNAGSPPPVPIAPRQWLERLDRWCWRRRRAPEADFARSKDVAEPEARVWDIARGFPSRYY